MYEYDVKPEIEQAFNFLNDIDYSKHSMLDICQCVGRAQQVLRSVLIKNPHKELVWVKPKVK